MQGAEGDQPLLLPRPAEGDAIPVVPAEGAVLPADAVSEVAAQDVTSEPESASNN